MPYKARSKMQRQMNTHTGISHKILYSYYIYIHIYNHHLFWLTIHQNQYNKLTHCVLIRPATLTRCVHYLKNSLTLERVLWTLIPPCGALSLSWRWRCLRGVHVKERYAPERSSLVRIAILRTIVGEEVGPSSGLLTCSVLGCENTCWGKWT